MIQRQLQSTLKKTATYFPVVSVTGPRQSGKTTLVRSTFPTYSYMSLEDPDVRTKVVADPRTFLLTHGPRCIVDEVQRVPDFFSYLQTYVDSTPDCSIVLTGSQNFLLMQRITQSLAGRVGLLTLMPFSISELKKSGTTFASFEEYAFRGSYPRIYNRDIPPYAFYSSYLQTYVERDVRDLSNISNLNAFHRFLSLCAGRVGQMLNYSTIATDVGLSVNTIKAWISILEASSLITLLPPYHKNFNKRVTRTPKLYFTDTGLVCHLLNISSAKDLHSHSARGAIFENLMISEFLKERYNRAKAPGLSYWRESNGAEVDCILEVGNQLNCFEFKSSATMSDDLLRGLKKWKEVTAAEPVRSWLIYAGEVEQRRSGISVNAWHNVDAIRALRT